MRMSSVYFKRNFLIYFVFFMRLRLEFFSILMNIYEEYKERSTLLKFKN